MSNYEGYCVTGTGGVHYVRPEFQRAGRSHDFAAEADLGSLDAPKRIAAGSTLANCWYELDGPRTIEREAA